MDLGRALVEELGLDPGVDTLSRWMAHYITELIEDAKAAKAENRTTKLSKCADAILKLWEHRHQLPNGKRPFEDSEPILRALESLDPDNNTPRYFRSQRTAVDETKEDAETRKWLELADSLDYSAKILICFCLTQAAQTALDRSKDWVKLAEAIGLDDGIDLPVIRFISDESNLLKKSEPDENKRKLLKDRIKRLDGFNKIANKLLSDLRRQIKQAEASKAGL
ncbi:MAG: AVAST type 3 anti-phage protein Avs3b [Smithellaceae bacterium]